MMCDFCTDEATFQCEGCKQPACEDCAGKNGENSGYIEHPEHVYTPIN